MNKKTVPLARDQKTPTSLADDAYRKIKLLILNREIVPGQKLVYDDLAKKLQMSRTPIINALTKLEQQGLVVSESFRGFTVKPMSIQEAWDSYGFREAIETYAVEQIIKHADSRSLTLLEEKVADYDRYKPNYYDRKKIFYDLAIHLHIAAMTNNTVLRWHLKLTMQHVYLRANLDAYDVERMRAAETEHHLLVTKIKDKDILGSVELIRQHVRGDRTHAIACLSNDKMMDESVVL